MEFETVTPNQLGRMLSGKLAVKDFNTVFNSLEALSQQHAFLCAVQDGRIVAVAKCFIPTNASNIHLEFIEEAVDVRGRGAGKILMAHLLKEAHEQGKIITSDGMTDKGRFHLQKVIEDGKRKFGTDIYQHIGRV